MREILFRGKRVDNGEWETGYYVRANYHWHKHGIHKDWIVTGACSNGGWFALHGRYPVIAETVGQYTGLEDKNGKRIFEGDICRFSKWSRGKPCWIGEVQYAHQQFIISGGANEECELPFVLQLSRFIPECIEVIGNIHDNPELIGGKEDGT